MKTFVIIGAGPGGYECAVKAAKAGLDVHIFDKAERLGGTCLCEGCIPTKCLCYSAEVVDFVKQAEEYGFKVDRTSFDFSRVIERKDKVIAKIQSGVKLLLQTPNITFHPMYVRFAPKDPHTILYENVNLHADYVMIATGAKPKFLPIPGVHLPGVLTSTELLNLKQIPSRICVIGGGVIGLEFASSLNAFGSKVTVIESCKEILPNFDKDIAKRLRSNLKKNGIEFFTNARVMSINMNEETNGLHVIYEHRDMICGLDVDKVLMSVGRSPNFDTLNLNEAGIHFTSKGISVNENFETNINDIYAVGDINGMCQLAHAATAQSYYVLESILGQDHHLNLDIIPSIVFTKPELATVGLTEEAAKERYSAIRVYKSYYRANGRAQTMAADNDGLLKLLTTSEGKIVGAHILGTNSSELIHEISVLMNKGGNILDIKSSIHAHPTFSEIIFQATSDLSATSI